MKEDIQVSAWIDHDRRRLGRHYELPLGLPLFRLGDD